MKDRIPLATPLEVAEYLQVPEKRLREWRYLGLGPDFVKVGGLVRYRWPDVERSVNEAASRRTAG